jgi:hypothetical protein
MLIKSADDRGPQLDALTALIVRPDVDAATRRRIEQEIRNISAELSSSCVETSPRSRPVS